MKISKNVYIAKENYDWIRDSTVAWRRKSSYRKPIKRRVSKLSRLFYKKETRQLWLS